MPMNILGYKRPYRKMSNGNASHSKRFSKGEVRNYLENVKRSGVAHIIYKDDGCDIYLFNLKKAASMMAIRERNIYRGERIRYR